MNTLKLKIENLLSIKKLELELPLLAGLYAITGKNGSAKSTSMAAIANLFYNGILKIYFDNSTEAGSTITCEYKNITLTHKYEPLKC